MKKENLYNITLAKNIKNVLKEIGEDPLREGLLKTRAEFMNLIKQ